MAYVKQNFVDGNVLYASELNHIEDGIADAYVKPASGIPTADIANDAITAVKIAANAVSTLYTATIPANGWTSGSNYATQDITVSGLLSTDNIILDVAMPSSSGASERQAINEAWGLVYEAYPLTNGLRVRVTDAPDIDIPIKMLCIRK